jgi:hypothetical protein
MHLGRINLVLLAVGAVRFVVTGEGGIGILLSALALALCLGLLDRKLQPSNQTATRKSDPTDGYWGESD